MSAQYPTLEDQVIVALRRIMRAVDLHSRELMGQYGLTAPQLAALRAVGRLQPVAIGALAKSIHLSQGTLTGIVSRLEYRSLVARERNGKDRRSVVLSLTVEGARVLERAPSLLQDRFRTELLGLREWEQTQMLAALQRIAAMMDAEKLEPAPILATGMAAEPPLDKKHVADVNRALVGNELPSVEPADELVRGESQSTVIDLTGKTNGDNIP